MSTCSTKRKHRVEYLDITEPASVMKLALQKDIPVPAPPANREEYLQIYKNKAKPIITPKNVDPYFPEKEGKSPLLFEQADFFQENADIFNFVATGIKVMVFMNHEQLLSTLFTRHDIVGINRNSVMDKFRFAYNTEHY